MEARMTQRGKKRAARIAILERAYTKKFTTNSTTTRTTGSFGVKVRVVCVVRGKNSEYALALILVTQC